MIITLVRLTLEVTGNVVAMVFGSVLRQTAELVDLTTIR